MRFTAGSTLVLTENRLLALDAAGEGGQWPLAPGLELRQHDHAGVGSLELVDHQRRLALWRFTLAQGASARALVAAFEGMNDLDLGGFRLKLDPRSHQASDYVALTFLGPQRWGP